jgi:hypothetical protein
VQDGGRRGTGAKRRSDQCPLLAAAC